ncbi:ABC transporter ATP-binding protein [Metabacillus niabensis]|uniref:ABC transporter ATP-binding protein n=1 Tax=Metabacillus niabensis TaxID=324854 RepID=UPI001CFA4E7A|nr:ABC transporter ATP-binding protein [Metabacillus niabensis]
MTTQIKNVEKSFGSFRALQQINLDINEGEFVAILGPSGCGKTTLLRLLAGFDSPTLGEVLMKNQVVANETSFLPPEKRNIGMVFQSFALWPHMNVRDHIRFPLKHHQFLSEDLKKGIDFRVDEVLKMVDMHHLGERMPSELSGGQKQRVALARAIAPKPALLLMDEPLSSLDAELRMSMRKEIQQLHHLTGASIVYVTHDQSEALAMADKIVVMNKGKIEQVGSPKEIYSSPTSPFVASFVGKANLIRGKWEGTTFYPFHQQSIKWEGTVVTEELRRENLFPARPEQLEISFREGGIKGVITNVQYQGKEIHYTITIEDEQWVIHQDLDDVFSIGEEVYIHLKKSQTRAKKKQLHFV